MRRSKRGGDIRPCAEAGIDQSQAFQSVERVFVQFCALGLNDWRAVDVETKPPKVLEYRAHELRAATGGIEIFDSDQPAPTRLPRSVVADDRRIGMAEVKPARRRGSKA